LGRSATWLKQHHRDLNRENCFPLPIPGSQWRFPRRALELWLIAGGAIKRLEGANANSPQTSLIEMHRRELNKRYGGGEK